MKNLSFLFLFSVLCGLITVQAQNYGAYSSSYGPSYGPQSESGACFALCLIPGDTLWITDTLLVQPGWEEPFVNVPYPATERVTYTVKEPCTTCDFTEDFSTRTQEEKVTVRPGYWEYFVTPCVWETVYDTIVVREATVKYEITKPEFKDDFVMLGMSGVWEDGICYPAVTGTRTGTVEIQEACTEVEVRPYTWEEETYEIEVSAATQKWVRQKADDNCLSPNPDDCLVWRLVDVPAEKEKCVRKVKRGCPYGYEDNGSYCVRTTDTPPVTKDYEITTCEGEARFEKAVAIIDHMVEVPVQTLKTPATYRKIIIPAEYKVIARQVVVEPARLDSAYVKPEIHTEVLTLEEKRVYGQITETPAVTESCTRTLCTEPEIRTEYHGPEYKTVTKTKISEGSFTEWREVMCPAEINPYTIGEIQSALYESGYNPGPVDRVMGTRTKAALVRYQREKGLPVGQLDVETLGALGIRKE